MLELLEPRITTRQTEDGVVLRSVADLPPAERCVGDWLVRWAEEAPDRTFLAERGADGGWTRLAYRAALEKVEGIASALLARGGAPDRPLMVLSDNSIDG